MAIRNRAIYCDPMIGSNHVTNWLSVKMSFQLDQGYAKASIVAPTEWGTYDDAVTIALGSDPGTCSGGAPPPIRFRGIRRDVVPDMYPRAVLHECIGQLGKAAEYLNGEDPAGISGLSVGQLLGGSLAATGNAGQIVSAVLSKAGVSFSPTDIGSSGRIYGTQFEQFIWKAGTHSGLDTSQILLPTEAGQAALDYIHRYDQVDAVATPLPPASATSGGFYRTFESLNGRVYRVLVGGRPRSIANFTFSEGDNILTANGRRGYPQADYVLVKGATMIPAIAARYASIGVNLGQMNYRLTGTNPQMGARIVYDKNPPSSDFIEWDTIAHATSAGWGMDCETVARARMLQVNRIIVSGTLTTAEDYLMGPGQTIIVQGGLGPGSVDRLLTGEPVWVQGVDYECSKDTRGAPVMTTTVNWLGGGLPDDSIPAPPLQ